MRLVRSRHMAIVKQSGTVTVLRTEHTRLKIFIILINSRAGICSGKISALIGKGKQPFVERPGGRLIKEGDDVPIEPCASYASNVAARQLHEIFVVTVSKNNFVDVVAFAVPKELIRRISIKSGTLLRLDDPSTFEDLRNDTCSAIGLLMNVSLGGITLEDQSQSHETDEEPMSSGGSLG